MRRAGLLYFVTVLAACAPEPGGGNGGGGGGGADASPGGGGGGGGGAEFADAAPRQSCEKMDILFVIDNSGSMLEEQDNLAVNFPQFISVLDGFRASNGAPIDYRVALTSTGVTKSWASEILPGFPFPDGQAGDDGRMLQRCGMTRPWVERADPGAANTFSCAAELGTSGPASEMPLASIKLALDERVSDGSNAGFVRDDALLAIVILTDEDDCSREDDNFTLGFSEDICDRIEPVETYKSFLDRFTGAPGRWAVAAIAGPGPGDCSSTFGSAAEAFRLKQLASLAGDNGVVASICEGDLSTGLQQALATFDTACQTIPPID
jgi:hypothetical protein